MLLWFAINFKNILCYIFFFKSYLAIRFGRNFVKVSLLFGMTSENPLEIKFTLQLLKIVTFSQ